ncbi:hypothetical protein W02_24550 [Nitrospira sp. KM1]|uniref:hypothetical protein n=1 Tax=Nitrospira sp. KM1 TaxID=1936990 RepID=UPI0013A75868|nr:hypothetical protein [Nitrospira sp. KM1]BCA55315.1 hypothetical protein W02_24550 [Nitrospira sp. KM1]
MPDGSRRKSSLDKSFDMKLNEELQKATRKNEKGNERTEILTTLICLDTKGQKTTPDAWQATILAGQLGIPAPQWAIELLRQASIDAVKGVVDIGVSLGYEGRGKGKKKAVAVQQNLQAHLHDDLCLQVRHLLKSGKSRAEAFKTVSAQLKGDWNPSSYYMKPPTAETLKKIYTRWDKKNGQLLTMIEGNHLNASLQEISVSDILQLQLWADLFEILKGSKKAF